MSKSSIKRVSLVRFAATAITALVVGMAATGCSGGNASGGQAQGALPVIKADLAHVQLEVPGTQKLIYEMKEGPGFTLDTSDYKFQEIKELASEKTAVQVIAGQGKVFRLPYTTKQLQYAITPEFKIEKGQRLICGIGYEVPKDGAVAFYPTWVGMIDVK
ncbi:MAG: hypothetical protein K2Y39_12555 [Candidatus Obscuribacterales bacterium]|nr:hypothetical protein [Candidatus Obscuribacterales bacterium]